MAEHNAQAAAQAAARLGTVLRLDAEDVMNVVRRLRNQRAPPSMTGEMVEISRRVGDSADARAALLSIISGKLLVIEDNPTTFIVSPQLAAEFLKNKMLLGLGVLRGVLERVADETRSLAAKRVQGEEADKLVESLKTYLEVVEMVHDIVKELAVRLVNLVAINLPSRLRPALANALMGFEIVGEEVGGA